MKHDANPMHFPTTSYEARNGWFVQWYTDNTTEILDPGTPDERGTANVLTISLQLRLPLEMADAIAEGIQSAFQAGQLDGAQTLRTQLRNLLSI